MNIQHLFQPFSLKALELKNRIVMAPMTRSFSPGGVPTSTVAEYYARRAQGEVGLIITEGTVVNRPAASSDPNIPHFRAVRQAVGADFVISLRISQWKLQDYSSKLALTPEELEAWVLPLEAAGVDIFHCSQRRFEDPEFPGSDLNLAGWIKKLTGKPTITVGSIGLSGDFLAAFKGESSTPSSLNELLRRFDRGDFDLVAVGRQLITNPEWPRLIEEGRRSEIIGFSKKALSSLS